MPKIANMCGCDRTTIKYWMKKHQIKRRNQSEANKLAFSDPELRKRIGRIVHERMKQYRKPLWKWLWDGFKEWRKRRRSL